MSTPGKGGLRADAVRNRQLALEAATELLAEPDTVLTVEAIAKRADLGAGTVVRAFGGKDALLDAAVAELLQPIVRRAQDLCEGRPRMKPSARSSRNSSTSKQHTTASTTSSRT